MERKAKFLVLPSDYRPFVRPSGINLFLLMIVHSILIEHFIFNGNISVCLGLVNGLNGFIIIVYKNEPGNQNIPGFDCITDLYHRRSVSCDHIFDGSINTRTQIKRVFFIGLIRCLLIRCLIFLDSQAQSGAIHLKRSPGNIGKLVSQLFFQSIRIDLICRCAVRDIFLS